MVTHQRQPEMPDLRVVPVAELVLHELHDAQRSKPLLQRLQTHGVLKNPRYGSSIHVGLLLLMIADNPPK
jgi:hypothetical protein